MFPSTVARVPLHTAEHVNQQIRRQTEQNIARYAQAGPAAIARRLEELDREWDVERTLEANAATASLIGLTRGATVDRRWFIFPAVVAGFLLQHAVQDWCPPMPLFRRLGFRTETEIDYERHAFKALRGDFRGTESTDPRSANHGATHARKVSSVPAQRGAEEVQDGQKTKVFQSLQVVANSGKSVQSFHPEGVS